MGDTRVTDAGRLLDARIAERQGRTVTLVHSTDPADPADYRIVEGGKYLALPHYSTDTNAALALFMEMPIPRLEYDSEASPMWTCSAEPEYGEFRYGSADTPALAICRAFLDWKNAEG
jgi:hypothetical protein